MTVVVELHGLEIPGRHGVEQHERETEQPFLYDIELELPEPPPDDIEHTADYRRVVELVTGVSESRKFQLLETLAAAVADALVDRLEAVRVRVRVRKPQVQLRAPVEHAAATVERKR